MFHIVNNDYNAILRVTLGHFVGSFAFIQMWNSSLAANTQGPLSNIAAAQPYQAVTTSHQVSAGIVPQPSPFQGESISSGRKELPAVIISSSQLFIC